MPNLALVVLCVLFLTAPLTAPIGAHLPVHPPVAAAGSSKQLHDACIIVHFICYSAIALTLLCLVLGSRKHQHGDGQGASKRVHAIEFACYMTLAFAAAIEVRLALG